MRITDQDAAKILRTAERLLEDVVSSLDERSLACGECGLNRYLAIDEHRMAEALRGALGRIERTRLEIERRSTR